MLNLFRSSGKKGSGNVLLWIIMGAAVVGLGGFSLVGVADSLSSQNVATVGEETVSRESFARSFDTSLREMSQRFNTSLSVEQGRSFGLDQQVLGQLVTQAALDEQRRKLDVSAGDEAVRDALLLRPEFQGPVGGFDKFTYDQAMINNNLSPREYEERIRNDLARTLLEAGVSGGVDMPDLMATTILTYIGERRGYSYAIIPRDRAGELPVPTSDALEEFYEAHPDQYTAPETRKITYIALQPDDMAQSIEITDEELQSEYDANSAQYNNPERRLVERIVFADMEEAEAAKASIDSGDETFEKIGDARGLSASEMDLGELSADDLPADQSEAVFGAENAGIFGPIQTDLGAALFRLNAILAPNTVSFDDAKEELRALFIEQRTGDALSAVIDPVQDLLASGATLEEIADETAMILGTIDISERIADGLASDGGFRTEAQAAEIGEERDLIDLQNGGIAALRLEEILPPALQDFDDVTEQVTSDWEIVAEQDALRVEGDRLLEQLAYGRRFDAVMKTENLELIVGEPVRRTESRFGLPSEMIASLFEMDEGETKVINDSLETHIITLTSIKPFDPVNIDDAEQLERLQGQVSNMAARDLFLGFTQAVQNEAGVTINNALIDQTLNYQHQ